MKLSKQPGNVEIILSPDNYYIQKSNEEFYGEYMLVHRIDMSYAGKDDQIGGTFMYLTEIEVEVFRSSGFSEIL